MEKCIFCEIVEKRIPAATVYEDNDFVAFLDISPLNPGHTLIMPKTHARWVFEVENFGDFWEVAKSVALAAIEALQAETVNFLTFGYKSPHAHIHCVPRFKDDGHGEEIVFGNRKNIEKEEMAQIAEKIKAVIANHPPKKSGAVAPPTKEPEKPKEEKPKDSRSEEDIEHIRNQMEIG
jgi:histidine triad (HIT) family protein